MKNLFKQYYPLVKQELKNYQANGKELARKFAQDNAPYDAKALSERMKMVKWHMLISKYLDICRDEEKKFLELLYFEGHPILVVGMILPLSARCCHEWREKALKNLLLMAADQGLLEFESNGKLPMANGK